MRIRINDAEVEVENGGTIASVVAGTVGGARHDGVAVALNDEVVPRTQWDRPLTDGDRLEIVRAVQGG